MKRFFLTLIIALLIIAGAVYGGSWLVIHETEDLVAGQMVGDTYTENITAEELREQADASDLSLPNGPFDCILVLGAGLSPDGTPSPMLEDRLELAIYLYGQGYSSKILLSGDNGTEYYDEVTAMRNFVLGQGVPEAAVVCDYAGFSTYDSMYRAQGIFGVQRAIVVTQGYHLPRALFIGKALDIDVCGAAADQETFSGQEARELREIVARDKDLIKSFIKPEARIMGDPLPIK
ncbi:MAG: YdcF family protein [Clostridiales bacterium]|nr:YdcF family protein [Clostridiales bacterium]